MGNIRGINGIINGYRRGRQGGIIAISEIFAVSIDSVDDIIEPWVKDILKRQMFVESIVHNMITE